MKFVVILRNMIAFLKKKKNAIIPAMYLNIEHFIESEYEQEKLLEAVNLLKYYENGLDRKIRLAREDGAKKVKKEITEQVTEEVTKEVTKEVTESFACKLLSDTDDLEYVHRMTDLPISRIKELKAAL